jgi:diguanylate cyclase (GGDEF)-like protein
MKILLVEDSATLRHAMSQYINDAGHTPLIARSGEEALQLLEDTPVDMIIMDVEMPGLNGFETTRLIREWLGGHWIPIIFVTGLNEDENYREGIEAGGDDYLIKPVSSMIIKAKIRAMERIAEMRDQLNRLNAELETLSQLDSLTQIYNRRTFNEISEQQWLIAARQQLPISALMIDVDHFKLYNDHYGHPAGDSCLKKVTQAIKGCLNRPADLLGRFGGEEFVVLLPETDITGAFRVAETITKAVEAQALPHEVSTTSAVVTVSVGGACCLRTNGHNLEELIKTADRALYKAKRTGRNRSLVDEVATHRTLLIVDPSQDALQKISALLQARCNILTADNITEALEIAFDVHPDLMIADAELADKDNQELFHKLARVPKTASIPLLLLAAESCAQRPASDSSFNVRGCLSKPFHDQTLLQKVQEVLNAN